MTIRSIKLAGDSVLHQPAHEVKDVASPEVRCTIDDLIDTLRKIDGVGLAATQIGVPLRIFVMRILPDRASREKCPSLDFTVFINPTMNGVQKEGKVTYPERCFSMPGLVGKVPRYKEITYQALNQAGEPINGVMKDFTARIFQHELHHLDGELYWKLITRPADFGFEGHICLF